VFYKHNLSRREVLSGIETVGIHARAYTFTRMIERLRLSQRVDSGFSCFRWRDKGGGWRGGQNTIKGTLYWHGAKPFRGRVHPYMTDHVVSRLVTRCPESTAAIDLHPEINIRSRRREPNGKKNKNEERRLIYMLCD